MQDALSSLISIAQGQPDLELLPWVRRELCRLSLRHFEDDAIKAAQLLGVSVGEVEEIARSADLAEALDEGAMQAASAKPAKRASRKASGA
jgi:hypothetical protein